MTRNLPVKPGQDDWRNAVLWEAGNHPQNILIPVEINKNHLVTGFVVLDDHGFPKGGQKTLLDYAGSSFRESCASLTIHHELNDPALEDSYTIALLKLAHSIDCCNGFSSNHAVKTAFWARRIAGKFGFGEEALIQIALASQLHDIGKVMVPKSVLTKPSQLSDQEWKIMKRHPTFGAMIMKPSPRLHALIPLVKAHHEHFNGSGYPMGMTGDQIPMQARIISVADTYATMTEGRVYRLPSSSLEALREIIRFGGKQFDPEVVSVMVDLATSGDVDDTQCRWKRI
jgi:HD-GYP domain-containing protein (c-di-GMP phosphodiesterase class II)